MTAVIKNSVFDESLSLTLTGTVLVSLLLILFMSLPLLPVFAMSPESLRLSPVPALLYYFGIHRPHGISPFFIFFSSVFFDLVSVAPLGFFGLLWLSIYYGGQCQAYFSLSRSFRVLCVGFAVAMLWALLLRHWAMAYEGFSFFEHSTLFIWLKSLGVFVLLYWVFERIKLKFSS